MSAWTPEQWVLLFGGLCAGLATLIVTIVNSFRLSRHGMLSRSASSGLREALEGTHSSTSSQLLVLQAEMVLVGRELTALRREVSTLRRYVEGGGKTCEPD